MIWSKVALISCRLAARTTPGRAVVACGLNHRAGNPAPRVLNEMTLNAQSGLLSWFQYGGDTYLVEAINPAASAAPHVGLQAGGQVVRLSGLVDLGSATFTKGVLDL
jgi:hypothetical protein